MNSVKKRLMRVVGIILIAFLLLILPKFVDLMFSINSVPFLN
jgi:hypothetical protein